MSAVLESPAVAAPVRASSGSVWAAAARRFRSDRAGMVSLAIVVVFLLLVIAAGLGLVAGDWQVERAVPDAPPTFLGPAPQTESITVATPSGPNVDISAVDPLAPRYKEWDEAAKK